MQALYALKQSSIANYHNALGSMDEVFAPNLLAEEKQDLKLLNEKKSKAVACLENFFKTKSEQCQETDDIRKAVNQAIVAYRNQVEKDKRHFASMLASEIDGIFENYILVLSFLSELADYTITENEDEKSKHTRTSNAPILELKFNDNKVISQIRKNKEYISNTNRGNLVWDKDLVRKVFRQTLKLDKDFKDYLIKKDSGYADDKELILHIVKDIIFKDEAVQAVFEEKDIKWQENKAIVKSMVLKTLKSIEPKDTEIKLLAISANWDEDRIFYEDLYKKTVDREEEYEDFVSQKIENWDIERLAAIDRIILVLAISEMVHFPSIPVKVSINEYIELSKQYSTPKSKQFINGILDKLAEDLTRKGMIRKSGRGLIDNK
jgi:N utilization substance protein B